MAARRSPVAFVLSGGAGLGAINGAFVAARPQTVEAAEELAGIWRRVRRAQVFPFNPVTGPLGFFGTRSHLVPDPGLLRLVSQHLQEPTARHTWQPQLRVRVSRTAQRPKPV